MSVTTVVEAKARAKALRTELARQGNQISHAQALELVARQHGARDWNTLHARLTAAEPARLHLQQRVRGQYLGQDFTGRIVALSILGQGLRRVTIRLDQPIDTVRFESFSNLRRQISGIVGEDGRSGRQTSDGQPQLIVRPG